MHSIKRERGRNEADVWHTYRNIFVFMFIFILCASSVAAQATFSIKLDEAGTATFTGNGTNITTSNGTSKLPQGVIDSNGTISGTTSFLTRKSGEIWTFSFSFPHSEIEVYLPALAVVKTLNGQLSVNDKQQIRIYANNTIQVSYTLPADAGNVDDQREKNNLLLVSMIFLIALASVLFFGRHYVKRQIQYLSTKKKRTKPVNSTEKKFTLITQLLNEKENRILNILREKGPMKSSYLQRTAEIPKSSFFRNLQELEKKKLIRRFGAGRNKIIEIILK